MADIRIKDLATTASSTASDDFLAVDGSANGTRKLNAYSPTFGGNLTVSGTGTSTISGNLDVKKELLIYGSNASSSGGITANSAAGGLYFYGQGTSTGMRFYTTNGSAASQLVLSLESTKQATFEGNLVVAGTGTSSVAGNLGVGVSPSTRLHVNNGNSDSGLITPYQFSNATGVFSTGDGGSNNTYLRVIGGVYLGANTTSLDLIHLGKDYNRDEGWRIKSGCLASNSNDGYLAFVKLSTNGTAITEPLEAGRFTSGGNLLIGTTTDGGQKLQVAGSVKIANNLSIFGGNASSAGTITANSAAGGLYFLNEGTSTGMRFYVTDGSANPVLAQTLDATTGNATFAGSIAINNTVQTAVSVASTHKVTISIGGTTYYLLATNV